MPAYHIVLVCPEGYRHIEALREVAEGLRSSLRALGHDCSAAVKAFDIDRINILLGGHLLDPETAAAIPPGSILYNLEQLGAGSFTPSFFTAAIEHQVWEYSLLNLARWQQYGLRRQPRLLGVGCVPELDRIVSAPEQDIDVLFYGSSHPRRNAVLDALRQRGLAVHHAFGVYGAERDALIARAKVVLNVHFYETQVFEIVRVAFLLNNGKAVVTETSPDLDAELAQCVLACPYERLVEETVALVTDAPRRAELARRGAEIFKQRKQVAMLQRVLEEGAVDVVRTVDAFPRKLNLGSGKDWRADCLNIDINDYWRPDAVLDIAQPQPDVIALDTVRFGAIQLRNGCFDEILANDVLEHIPDLMRAMSTALRLLRTGGLFQIQVPYDLSWGAWQDPTHVRAFNERSWLYYTEWFWYMGWTEARFTVQKLDFALSPIGERLRGELAGADLVRAPRAVDSMRVTLAKQPLTEGERAFAASYLKRPEQRVGAGEPVAV